MSSRFKRTAAILLAMGWTFLGIIPAPARAQDVSRPEQPGPPASSLSESEIRKILVDRVDVEHRDVGIVVGLITPKGRRVISYGRPSLGDKRPLDGDSVFEIGSVTKIFTSLLLTDSVRRGEVSLSDPLAQFLPNGVRVPGWRGRPITLVDLSTQTSGLPFFPTNYPLIDDAEAAAKDSASYSLDQLYDFLNTYELLHDVGVNWEYSNLGVGLLGFALARRAGTNYETLVRARITGPLGMKSTAVSESRNMKKRLAEGHNGQLKPVAHLDFPEFFAGAGSLKSTANDMLTFLAACMGYRETPLAPAMSAMLETSRPGSDWLAFLGGRQALGWWVIGKGDDRIIAHAGETIGFSCSVAFNPTTRVGAVALANGSGGGADLAMHIVRPSYPLTPNGASKPRQEVPVDPRLFDFYTGKYQLAPNVIVVIGREGDKLWFMAPGSPRVRLRAEGERDYFIPQADVQVTFQTDGQGPAKRLILHLYGQFNLPATRIDAGEGKK